MSSALVDVGIGICGIRGQSIFGLTVLSGLPSALSFAHNGLGDRLSQTVGVTQTRYALDPSASSGQAPAAGLTQVLSDGTNAYLYGQGRVGQYQSAMQYFGPDALGSVRQIYNASGQVMANARYDPYGNVVSAGGAAASAYGFTGEQQDAGTGLEYLRARYYAPAQGRFTTRDVWEGDAYRTQTLNRFAYVTNNPTLLTDPTGHDGPLGAGTLQWGGIGTGIVICSATGVCEILVVAGSGFTILSVWSIYSLQHSGPYPQLPYAPAPPQTKPQTTPVPWSQPGCTGFSLDTCVPKEFVRPQPKQQPQPEPVRPNPIPAPTCPPNSGGDFIWRGIDAQSPKARDFRPRAPIYNDDGSMANPRDADGLSFFEGRQRMWAATAEGIARGFEPKAYRAGFTESELIAGGYSVRYDQGELDPWTHRPLPLGHVSVKRLSNQEWDAWLFAQAGTPNDIYSQTLAEMATRTGRVELNVAP